MKKILFFLISFTFFLSACAADGSQGKSINPTEIFSEGAQTQSSLVSDASTTLTSNPAPLATANSPIYQPANVISIQNAANLIPIERWGNGNLNAMVLSPDGKTLAAATTIGVALYATKNLELIDTLFFDANVNALAFSSEGKYLAIGKSDGASIWDMLDGLSELNLSGMIDETDKGKQDVTSLAYSLDGKWLAVGTENGTDIIDADTGELIINLNDLGDFENFSRTTALAFSPDSQMLAAAQSIDGGGSLILIWNTLDWKLKGRIDGDINITEPGGLTFSSNGKTLAYPSSKGYLWLWKVSDGTSEKPEAASGATVYTVVGISSDSSTVAGGAYNGVLNLWDRSSGKNRRYLQLEGSPVKSLIFTPVGRKLYAGATDGIRTWDLISWKIIRSAVNHASVGDVISYSPDGMRMATYNENEVIIWDLSTGAKIRTFQGKRFVSVASDWSRIAAVSKDDPGTLLLYDIKSGSIVRSINRGSSQTIEGLFFSPDGSLLAEKEASSDSKLLLWDAASGTLLQTLTGAYNFQAFSPDGKSFATVASAWGNSTSGLAIQFWDGNNGTLASSLNIGAISYDTLAFSPDGSLVAVQGERTTTLWDKSSGKLIWRYDDDVNCSGNCSLVFSPDGKLLAVGGYEDNSFSLLNASTGELLIELNKHHQQVTALAFSPDESQIASSGKDGVVYFWGISAEE